MKKFFLITNIIINSSEKTLISKSNIRSRSPNRSEKNNKYLGLHSSVKETVGPTQMVKFIKTPPSTKSDVFFATNSVDLSLMDKQSEKM